jgi:hypothetical protein
MKLDHFILLYKPALKCAIEKKAKREVSTIEIQTFAEKAYNFFGNDLLDNNWIGMNPDLILKLADLYGKILRF